MTSKRQSLMVELARLAGRHSPSDWRYAAENFEEIGHLARQLAEKARSPKAPRRKSSANSKIKAVPSPEDLSPLTEAFARFLNEKVGGTSGPNLRDVANFLGMKSDLPRGTAAIIGTLCRHLETLDQRERASKIAGAVGFVEQHSPRDADHYDRWVSLITRK